MKKYIVFYIGRISTGKVTILYKTTYRLNAIPIKIYQEFFIELQQIISELVWKHKHTNSQNYLGKEQNWRIQVPWLLTILQSYQNSIALAEKHSHISMEQKRNPEINPHTYGSINLWQRKNTHGKKGSLFNKWCWENWTATCKRMKVDPCPTPYTKINLEWMISFECKTWKKLLEKIKLGKKKRL